MIVIYAEKPDVGRKIAAALDAINLSNGKKVSFEELSQFEKDIKAQQLKDGFLKIAFLGEETFVTWGYGHLCELKSAKDYDEAYKQWRNIPVPFIPRPYEVKVKDESKKQFNVVRSLIAKSTWIINATDYDKEGEVIFFYLMQAMHSSKPFKRAHFSSQTKEGFLEAFRNLKPSEAVKNMTDAGRSRSIADWVVGCNLTVAMSLKYSGNSVLSIGRVQTPTLNMLVEKELAIRNFVPEPYYTINAVFETDNHEKYEAESVRKRISDKAEAEAVYNSLIGKRGIVEKIDKKDVYKDSPLLYNLSALQMAANAKYGFTLAETLEMAQFLYENGYTTYPRSDSQYLTEDMEPVVNDVLDALSSKSSEYARMISGRARNIDRKKYFDNSKVTSHYAIIPTTSVPASLSPSQKKIYDLIARSVIMMVYPKAHLQKTTVITSVGEEGFSSTGSIVIDPGWMAIDAKPEEKLIPELVIGQSVFGKYSIQEKQTEPPKHYTDKTLVRAMIGAGKELDDEELKKAMADAGNKGIGTEATRASIIETLITRQYAIRQGKSIVPTERGICLIQALPLKEIKSAELTAQWEERLENIALGKENMNSFLADIEKATERWCVDIQSATKENVFASANDTGLKCPGCGSPLTKHKWGYGCSNYKNGCKMALNNTIASKTLTDKQIETLLVTGSTGNKPLSGFVSKSGKKFEAVLSLSVTVADGLVTESKVSFIFPNTSDPAPKAVSAELRCPSCGATLTTGKWAWECSDGCGFSFRYKIAKREMKEADLREIIEKGHTSYLNGFVSKEGKYFVAALRLKESKKDVEFEFYKK